MPPEVVALMCRLESASVPETAFKLRVKARKFRDEGDVVQGMEGQSPELLEARADATKALADYITAEAKVLHLRGVATVTHLADI
jgi:hypothetical protein